MSGFRRSATRSGWRGVVLLALIPVVVASFAVAVFTHGTVRSVAGDAYCTAAAGMIGIGLNMALRSPDD